jgi:dienelactone hydrolase
MDIVRWIIACLVSLACQTALAANEFTFAAAYGPYPVGFRVAQLYDPSRSYRDGTDTITGEAVPGPSQRPIQTLIWYPASAPGRPLVYSDYLDLSGNEDRFDLDKAQASRIAESALREWIANGASPADVSRIKAEPVHATGDAALAPGRFPVIVYAASDTSPASENDVLCEYLASHGYVVIASPSHGAHVRYMTDGRLPNDLENTRAQAADIGFLIGYAQTLPDVDSSKVGVVGYSWGGMASTFAAVADSRIHLLVDLDGSVRYFPKLLAAAPDITPDQIHVPLLFFADQEDPLAPGKDSQPNSFIARIHHADVTEIGLRKLSHDDLSADSLRFLDSTNHGGATADERNESYGWVARYTLAFLDAILKDDPGAKVFMKATPVANHIPPGTLAIQYRPSQGPGASDAGFAQALAKGGFAHAIETYAAYTRSHPDFHLTTDTLNPWIFSLMNWGKFNEAVDLAKLGVHLAPKSTDAWSEMGVTYEVANQPKDALESYNHVLALDSHSVVAAKRIEALKLTRGLDSATSKRPI